MDDLAEIDLQGDKYFRKDIYKKEIMRQCKGKASCTAEIPQDDLFELEFID
jgi:hypothetical protein